MLYSKKLTSYTKESNRAKVNLDSSFIFLHHERRRAGLFSINVRVEKILLVHRQGGLNLSISLIICLNENKKLLRNF